MFHQFFGRPRETMAGAPRPSALPGNVGVEELGPVLLDHTGPPGGRQRRPQTPRAPSFNAGPLLLRHTKRPTSHAVQPDDGVAPHHGGAGAGRTVVVVGPATATSPILHSDHHVCGAADSLVFMTPHGATTTAIIGPGSSRLVGRFNAPKAIEPQESPRTPLAWPASTRRTVQARAIMTLTPEHPTDRRSVLQHRRRSRTCSTAGSTRCTSTRPWAAGTPRVPTHFLQASTTAMGQGSPCAVRPKEAMVYRHASPPHSWPGPGLCRRASQGAGAGFADAQARTATLPSTRGLPDAYVDVAAVRDHCVVPTLSARDDGKMTGRHRPARWRERAS